jgi:RimK family alpha-L-glutamate ligase
MKKGWFVYNGYYLSESTQFLVDKITSEFTLLGCPLKVFKSNELLFYCDNDGNIVNGNGYEKPDFVVFWDKDLPKAAMLEKWGTRLFNKREAVEICDSKIFTHIALSNCGVKMPKTVLPPLVYSTCTENNDIFIGNLLKVLDFPIVVKEAIGSFGEQVYLAKDINELKTLRKKLLHTPHLYQEFVKTSIGKDVRAIVLDGKVIAAMQRNNEHDFRANVELGGDMLKIELPPSFAEVAEYVAEVLKLDFCGVDLLFGADGEPLLCEVNSNPYLRGIMQSTGVNVAGLYAKYILSIV